MAAVRPGRFDAVDQELAGRSGEYARSVVWFTPFERFWMLRGFENALMDPCTETREFARLRDAIVQYDLASVRRFLERGVVGTGERALCVMVAWEIVDRCCISVRALKTGARP